MRLKVVVDSSRSLYPVLLLSLSRILLQSTPTESLVLLLFIAIHLSCVFESTFYRSICKYTDFGYRSHSELQMYSTARRGKLTTKASIIARKSNHAVLPYQVCLDAKRFKKVRSLGP